MQLVRNDQVEKIFSFVRSFEVDHDLTKIRANVVLRESAAVWIWKGLDGADVAALTFYIEGDHSFSYVGMINGGDVISGAIPLEEGLWT